MSIVGYARANTIGQSLDVQLDKLNTFGCDEILNERKKPGARLILLMPFTLAA
jgi:hypothetical protein